MEETVRSIARESARLVESYVTENAGLIVSGAKALAAACASGHVVFIFGNGGSAADSQHIAAEFVNRFAFDRRPLPAVALTTDTSILTAVGNDDTFEHVFSRQILALGRPGDVALGISTSGTSPNVLAAMDAAREKEMFTMALSGRGGGPLADKADIAFSVPGSVTPRIQETHIVIAHILCGLVEEILFPKPQGQ